MYGASVNTLNIVLKDLSDYYTIQSFKEFRFV
jgi:hypothetical protein